MSPTPPSFMRWIASKPHEITTQLPLHVSDSSLQQQGIRPYDAKLKLTFRCNAQCYYCLHGIKTHVTPLNMKETELSAFEWKKIIKELHELGTQVITFSGGEPTIVPELPDLVKLAGKKLGMRVKMTTNGSLLTESLANQLAKNKLKSVNISLDGIGKDHDKVRGPNFFERTWAGIHNLDQARKKYGRPQIRINHVITSQNYHKVEDFMLYIENSDIDISAIHLLFVDFNHNSDSLSLPPEALAELRNKFVKYKNKITMDVRETNMLVNLDVLPKDFSAGNYAPEALKYPCYFPYFHMFILPNGDVNVCCGAERKSELILGNVKTTPVKDVWEGNAFKELRSYLLSNKFSFCSACDHGIEINKSIHNYSQ